MTNRIGASPMPTSDRLDPSDALARRISIGEQIAERPEPILNYTFVALVGMLGGFILGSLISHPDRTSPHGAAYPPVPHPRALESQPIPTR
ncbi:MAG TPA: hypothetical protein VHE61_01205 [Opitutaceae bacterium]|nr:hypothetical protein [Opitutaceae bacterium]